MRREENVEQTRNSPRSLEELPPAAVDEIDSMIERNRKDSDASECSTKRQAKTSTRYYNALSSVIS
jgi:hypothetical protein